MQTFSIDEFGDERPQGDIHYADPTLKTIERIRLLSDPLTPWWDVSYVWGRDEEGTLLRVQLPSHVGHIRKRRPVSHLIRLMPDLPTFVSGGYVKDVVSLCQ